MTKNRATQRDHINFEWNTENGFNFFFPFLCGWKGLDLHWTWDLNKFGFIFFGDMEFGKVVSLIEFWEIIGQIMG